MNMPLVSANGAELYYEEAGDGPALILTPGGLQHGHEVFDDVIHGLAIGHRVIAYDRRFAGRSRSPLVVQTWDMMADDIVGLMDGLGIDRADIGGGATGSAISLRCAARHPDRIRSVFGVNINGGSVCTSFLMMHLVQSMEIAERQGIAAVLAAFDPEDRYGPFVPPQALVDGPYRSRLLAMEPSDFAQVMRDTIAALFDGQFVSIGMTEQLLGSIHVPALIMHGPGDDMHPRAVAERVASLIAGSRWGDVASFRRRADQAAFVEHVLSFLGSIEAAVA
jgi:3-oxoadipate enol-lactonase